MFLIINVVIVVLVLCSLWTNANAQQPSEVEVKQPASKLLSSLISDLSGLFSQQLNPVADEILWKFTAALKEVVSNHENDFGELVKALDDFHFAQLIHLIKPEKKYKRVLSDSVAPKRVAHSQENSSGYLPVIQMHGMGDFAKDPFGMVPLANAVSAELNNTYVLNMQIGSNSMEDILNGFLMNLDDQVDYFAKVIWEDPQFTADGFNAIGYSQGNLVIRGYIERYNNPPVKNFISMHGPLAGVAAFPGCDVSTKPFCRLFSEVLGALAYHPNIQDHLTQANYFRDPFKIATYQEKARFLPDINNEDSSTDLTYSSRWQSLQSLCLVKALGDTVVIPRDSEWFGFFQDNSFDQIWAFNQTPWYNQDLFGLKSLDEQGKIFFETTDENHLDFSTDYLLSLVDRFFK